MIQPLHIQLLGDFLLVSDNTPVIVSTPRLQSVLAYLVLHHSVPQKRSHLAFLLWPDSAEAQAHSNLRKLLYQLRQILPNINHFVSIDRHSVQWRPSSLEVPWTLDVLQIENAIAEAKQATQDTKVQKQALQRVLDLYRGKLLPDCYDEWVLPERERVHQIFFEAVEHLLILLEQERDYDAAIKTAQRLLLYDSLHEVAYRNLMRFYALRGDRAAALRVYHTCVTVLERELAIEPEEATRQAYEALLNTNMSLKPPSFMSQGVGTPLVGRRHEWEQLQRIWRRVEDGQIHIVVLSGEAGIGKTKLAEEMLVWASRQGMITARAHCYAAEGRLAYAPVTAWLQTADIQQDILALDTIWLSEIARLLPDLLIKRPDLSRPTPMTQDWQRQHFFEALTHALLNTRQPLLLLLDDLQWCDDETLEWLHYLLRFEPHVRLLLVTTVRSEEILAGHPLLTLLSMLQRNSLVTEITLEPLNANETLSLAEHIVGHQLSTDMDSLYSETEGNPLFVVEMVRVRTQGQQENGVQKDAHSVQRRLPLLTQPASTLPPTIQGVLTTRLAQLSPVPRELANVAAVIGREFSFAVLTHASREGEEIIVQGLDELWHRRIVREKDSMNYDFSHDKLREQTYAMLSSAQRHLLHRRVAEAFEVVYAENLDSVSIQIAMHYERASLSEQAIPYYQRAGEVAQRIYAKADAIHAFQQAITLLEASTNGYVQREKDWKQAPTLYERLGDIFETAGQQLEARESYQRAMAHIPVQEYIWQARLCRKSANTWKSESGNPQEVQHIYTVQGYKEAERMLGQVHDKSSTEWLQEWIHLHLDQLVPLRASADEMTDIIEKARPVVEQHGTPEQRGLFFLTVCMRDLARDRYIVSEETVLYCLTALAVIAQTDDTNLLGFAHFALGTCLLWSGHLDEAEKHLRIAMRVGEQMGHIMLRARCMTFLPFIYRQRGQVEAVRHEITRALSLPQVGNIKIVTGHRAWVAWRDGNLSEAEKYARATLDDWQYRRHLNSFHWTGVWPLIAIVLGRENIPEAIDYVRMLLDPTQQPLSEKLRLLLERALQAWDREQYEFAHTFLQQALPVAEDLGYL